MTKQSLPDADAEAHLTILEDVMALARDGGADAADALIVSNHSQSLSVRLGEREDIERAEASDLGLRVFIGKRQAVVSSSDLSRRALTEAVDRALSMARLAPEDPWCGLADSALLAGPVFADLDLYDPTKPDIDALARIALEAEDAARGVEGITNSLGAGASSSHSEVSLMTSHGFAGSWHASSFSVSASVLAGEGTAMERDYDYSSARHFGDLDDPVTIGRSAGERTVRRLQPSKTKTGKMPVVFDPRVGNSLLGHLAGAISGPSVARGTSFLKNHMGEAILPVGISVIDDPLRVRGLRSKPFDGEGVATHKRTLVDNGVLKSWVLNSASARQLGLETTGNATRGTGGPPGVGTTNLYLSPGTVTPEALIADIDLGLYVTDLIGMGVNGVTGDYSRGAAGFLIEKGEISRPISEITIAGNLKDMFRALVPANDLEFRYGLNVPTLRIDGMTVAGN